MQAIFDHYQGSQTPFIYQFGHYVTRGEWFQDVVKHCVQFKQHKEQKWLLYEADFYQFSVYFVALLCAQKEVLLATNAQPEKQKELQNEFEIAILPQSISGINCWKADALPADISTCGSMAIHSTQKITFLTSGSSGSPKKIEKKWQQLSNEVECQQSLWAKEFENALVIASVGHQHIYGLIFKLLLPLLTGKAVYAPMIQFPEHLQHFKDHGNNVAFFSSPAFLTRTAFEDDMQNSMQALRCIFSSGGLLPEQIAKRLHNINRQAPIELYGSTETGGIAWRQYANDYQWTALPNIKVKCNNDYRLVIKSPFLADEHWFETDDLVSLVGSSQFELNGRVDRIIKLEEKRLSLTEMESIVNRLPQCHRAIAATINNQRMQLVMVIEWADLDNLTTSNKQRIAIVKEYLSGFYEPVLLPRKWRFVDIMPVNEQGKTPQAMLIKMFEKDD